MARNYSKETAYEERPNQVKRREARNRQRARLVKAGKLKKGDGKEEDHQGYHRTGSLDNVPVKVVSARKNLKRQPPTKARGKKRNTK